MNCAFGVVIKKSLPKPRSPRFSHRLSSTNFILLHFTFRCIIHLELIFVKDVRSVSRFPFFFFSWALYSVPFICPFFHQCHIVLITVAL